MKKYYITYLLCLVSISTAIAQSITLSNSTNLASQIDESSGLEYLQSSFFTHNDDTDVKLFEFDVSTGNIVREVTILNASNTDWEDLATDGSYMYIGDFGNNNGNRTNLKIYKCQIDSSTGNLSNTVTAEEISFSYAEQTDFNPGNKNHNFDAEAVISIDSALFLFTKNWVNTKTHIYQISKTPGTYSINKMDEIEVPGLVTAAEYIEDLNAVVLIGYTETNGQISDNFATIIANFNSNQFSSGSIFNVDINVNGSKKTEGLVIDAAYNLYVSSEANAGNSQVVYSINLYAVLDSFLTINDTSTNPIDTLINPNDTTTNPNDTLVNPNDTTTIPNDTLINPNDTTQTDTSNTNPDDTVSLYNLEPSQNFMFYPNPVRDEINVIYFDQTQIEIFDLTGQCLIKSIERKINLSSLSSGIYFVKFSDKDGNLLQVEKILKKN